jgi:hypothetical protein
MREFEYPLVRAGRVRARRATSGSTALLFCAALTFMFVSPEESRSPGAPPSPKLDVMPAQAMAPAPRRPVLLPSDRVMTASAEVLGGQIAPDVWSTPLRTGEAEPPAAIPEPAVAERAPDPAEPTGRSLLFEPASLAEQTVPMDGADTVAGTVAQAAVANAPPAVRPAMTTGTVTPRAAPPPEAAAAPAAPAPEPAPAPTPVTANTPARAVARPVATAALALPTVPPAVPVPAPAAAPPPEPVTLRSLAGRWAPDRASCSERNRRGAFLPLTLSERGAKAGGASCSFRRTDQQGNRWVVAATCKDGSETWNANVRLVLAGSKLTWSSERGTQTYSRC